MKNGDYSITEIENMMPWEREVYTTLLQQHFEEQNERAKKAKYG